MNAKTLYKFYIVKLLPRMEKIFISVTNESFRANKTNIAGKAQQINVEDEASKDTKLVFLSLTFIRFLLIMILVTSRPFDSILFLILSKLF